jgi:hypothetical protein
MTGGRVPVIDMNARAVPEKRLLATGAVPAK